MRPRESKTQLYLVVVAAIVFLLTIAVPRFTPSEQTGPRQVVVVHEPDSIEKLAPQSSEMRKALLRQRLSHLDNGRTAGDPSK